MNKFLEILGKCVLAVIGFVAHVNVLYYGWLWFIVPFGVPILGYIHLYGLCGLVRFFVTYPNFKSAALVNEQYKAKYKDIQSITVIECAYPWLVWFFLYLVHLCM